MTHPDSMRCCWPDCFEWRPLDLTVPMCWKHSRITAEDFGRACGVYDERIRSIESKSRPKSHARGKVYYLRVDGLIKIGYSSNVYGRLRAYPPSSELLAVEPGSMETERLRHGQFRADLKHGREWFRESDDLKSWITAVRQEHGPVDSYVSALRRPAGGGVATGGGW